MSKLKEGKVPLSSAWVRPQVDDRVWFWSPLFMNNIEKLESRGIGPNTGGKEVETKPYEEGMWAGLAHEGEGVDMIGHSSFSI